MNSHGFPVDIVLIGMVALFLALRLWSVLGRRTGFERPAPPETLKGKIIEGEAEPAPPPPAHRRLIPPHESETGQVLRAMQRLDPRFDPAAFLEGAERAFRLIVGAFAAGDRRALAPLLGPVPMAAFEQAIAAREAAGETAVAEIKGFVETEILRASLTGSLARVTVRFVSDQINFTRARNGQVTHGTEAVTEITDIWTFERDLATGDPTWRLVAVEAG
jgi:predicted lipid-binding transport protein (Tim44 family)